MTQQASTDQAAGAAAGATQQQPSNVVISVRINSPGNDGPISQTNVAGSVADASNDGSTDQGGAAGGQQGSQQQATTDQAATATATTTQEQPQNVVIIIRINSPGDNGPIEQTNIAGAVLNAGNLSATGQSAAGNGAADGTATGAAPDPRAAIGPPAQQESPAATPTEASPRMSVALLKPAAPKTAVNPGHRVEPPPAHRDQRPAGNRANSAPASMQTASTEPSDPAATAVRLAAREPLTHAKPARRADPARSSSASRNPGVARRAVDLLGKLAPRPPVPASGGSEQDVTNAVVFTLIAVLGAFFVFLGSTYLSSGLRLFHPRGWRYG